MREEESQAFLLQPSDSQFVGYIHEAFDIVPSDRAQKATNFVIHVRTIPGVRENMTH